MKILSLLILLLSSTSAYARGDNEFLVHAGLGLGAGQFSITNEDDEKASFQAFNYFLQAGLEAPLFWELEFQLGAEIGASLAANKMKSETAMEQASSKYQALKGGFGIGSLGFGAGLRKTSLTIKTLQDDGDYSETTHEGDPMFYYLNFNFDHGGAKSAFRSTLEAQYLEGTIDQYKMNDVTLSLRFYILLDPL